MKYIASCSGGKDSVATILLALEHGEPLDEVVYCEVMFSPEISGEVPEHREFVVDRLKPFVEKVVGCKFTHLVPKKTYLYMFHHMRKKGLNIGKKCGFAFPARCDINRSCKMPPIRAHLKTLGEDVTQYIGIEFDETDRLMRLEGTNKVSLLEKYRLNSADARQLCEQYGLLSPSYIWCRRNGCWFCPNIKDREIGHLMIDHPHLWQALLDLGKTPNIVRTRLTYDETPSEIDARLRLNGVKMSLEEIMWRDRLPARHAGGQLDMFGGEAI
ncbi:phosphoadenosine phosphosulfate reductase [Ruminococcaceae bacterium OttesenSCG-928-D13]|nr:phosphoadenosine phosphosulfate reductase [Ruminococcaceae bacterium OttesenSCG-928-D13]